MIDWVSIVRHSRRRFSNYVGSRSPVRMRRRRRQLTAPPPQQQQQQHYHQQQQQDQHQSRERQKKDKEKEKETEKDNESGGGIGSRYACCCANVSGERSRRILSIYKKRFTICTYIDFFKQPMCKCKT